MNMHHVRAPHKIFLGVISSKKGASNSIRNTNILSKIRKENYNVLEIDFGIVFNANQKFTKVIWLVLLIIKSLIAVLWHRNSDLIISTNPKWLLLVPCLAKKPFTLYLGDPFIGDVSTKSDKTIYSFLWNRSKRLINTLYVFSPFLCNKLEKELIETKVKFLVREPIPNLPKMLGDGILYLGDFWSIDRDFQPFISVFEQLNLDLDIFGVGENNYITNSKGNITIYERRPFSELIDTIPNYKFMLIILNKSGLQVPGKIYDFAQAPFKVLVLYEDSLDIELLPKSINYFYCKNVASEIKKAIIELL